MYLWHQNKFRIKWDFSCGPWMSSFSFCSFLGWMDGIWDGWDGCAHWGTRSLHWVHTRKKQPTKIYSVWDLSLCGLCGFGPKVTFLPKESKIRLDSYIQWTRIVSYGLISDSCLPQEMKTALFLLMKRAGKECRALAANNCLL